MKVLQLQNQTYNKTIKTQRKKKTHKKTTNEPNISQIKHHFEKETDKKKPKSPPRPNLKALNRFQGPRWSIGQPIQSNTKSGIL